MIYIPAGAARAKPEFHDAMLQVRPSAFPQDGNASV
jgi:hypothetical protein